MRNNSGNTPWHFYRLRQLTITTWKVKRKHYNFPIRKPLKSTALRRRVSLLTSEAQWQNNADETNYPQHRDCIVTVVMMLSTTNSRWDKAPAEYDDLQTTEPTIHVKGGRQLQHTHRCRLLQQLWLNLRSRMFSYTLHCHRRAAAAACIGPKFCRLSIAGALSKRWALNKK